MSLLLWLNIFIVMGPLLLSFDKRVQFYKQWKTIIPSALFVGILFLVWGRICAKADVFGFNPDYYIGISYFGIPIEEYPIYFAVAFLYSFIYVEVKSYIYKYRPVRFAYYFALLFTLLSIILGLSYHNNWYTSSAMLVAGVLNWVIYFGYTPKWYPYFSISYLVTLIPILFVHGLIFGVIIENPLIVYNPDEIIGFRILSIPIEEFFFIFIMSFTVVVVHEFLKKKWVNRV